MGRRARLQLRSSQGDECDTDLIAGPTKLLGLDRANRRWAQWQLGEPVRSAQTRLPRPFPKCQEERPMRKGPCGRVQQYVIMRHIYGAGRTRCGPQRIITYRYYFRRR